MLAVTLVADSVTFQRTQMIWYQFALQKFIDLLSELAANINMSCNIQKNVCMILNPTCKNKTVRCTFPEFTLNGACLKYVSEFKYLGHIISNSLCDNDDVQREIRSLL